jgi:hypothetical protein
MPPGRRSRVEPYACQANEHAFRLPLVTPLENLYLALGDGDFQAALDAFRAQGGDARQFMDGLAAQPAFGRPKVNGRAVMEDFEYCLSQFARSEPLVVLEAARRRPELLQDFAFVSALRAIEMPEATELLLQVSTGKGGALRWLALEALLARKEPRAIARLNEATNDRDGLVVFSAVVALRRYAQLSDLPRLLEIVAAPRTKPGTREAAIDAIEAACTRAGSALPPGLKPRLLEVALPAGAVPNVSCATLVEAGAPLTQGPAKNAVLAPCRAVVVDVVADGAPVVVVLRRAPRA